MSENSIRRRWRFRVEDPGGEGCYVGPDGEPDADCEWIGTDAESVREGDRRADAWENATQRLCLRLVCESQGRVTPAQPTAQTEIQLDASSDPAAQ